MQNACYDAFCKNAGEIILVKNMPQSKVDPFSESIIQEIPKSIRNSFTDDQMNAIENALLQHQNKARHLLDTRFTLPLFFTRLYIVVFIGKDKRTHYKKSMIERRRKGSLFSKLAFSLLLLINTGAVLLLLILFSSYLAKTILGIDLFPDQHLWDFFIR